MRWYPLLVPREGEKTQSLLSKEEFEDGNLIVCKQEKYRSYSKFDSYLAFRDFWIKTPDEEKHFYEVILGNKPQKIYFDIDIDEKYLVLIENSLSISSEKCEEEILFLILSLRDEIYSYIKEISSYEKIHPEILIYSSHSERKENGRRGKMSFHLVVNNFCVSSNVQASLFFEEIKKRVTTSSCEAISKEKEKYTLLQKFIFSEILDSKIYTSKRQFRILGCSKYSQNRPKIFEKEISTSSEGGEWKMKYTLRNEIHYKTEILFDSLVSYVRKCNYLPSFAEKKKERKTRTLSSERESETQIDLNEDVADKVLEMYCRRYNLDSSPFSLLSIEQDELQRGILIFKRDHPSFCEKCDRVHEHENVFFVVWGEEMNVAFDCRRGDERVYLGKMKIEEEVSSLPSEKEIEESDLFSVGEKKASPKRIEVKKESGGVASVLLTMKRKSVEKREGERASSFFSLK